MAPSRDRRTAPLRAALVLPLVVLALVLPGVLQAAAAADPVDPDPPTEPTPFVTTLVLTGPGSVVDERSIVLDVAWTGPGGLPVLGSARLWSHGRGQPWKPGPAVPLDLGGRARITVGPRVDTWFQVRGDAGLQWQATRSTVLYVDNRPPGVPVVLPSRAPKPEPLPAQPRATLPGAAVVVTKIPDAVWKRMVGRSWRKGCPVGRTDLRYLQTNYWGFDGYRHRGELVVRASAAADFAQAVRLLHDKRVPIRAMYLVDRFGYSKRSQGADDFASMRHDNTSAFNCRSVTGKKGLRSPHTFGRSIDLNPFENPFRSAVGWLPNRWWIKHAHPRYAWRSRNHVVVRVMRVSGFRWSYPRSDPQHFDS